MLMFNENIRARNTAHNINILTVPEYQEIYFDVFEIEVDGCKYIAEKIDDYKGAPVVSIPLVIEGKEYTAPFVLHQGVFDVLFNKNNSSYVKDVHEDLEEITIDEPDTVKFLSEKSDSILEDIKYIIESTSNTTYTFKIKGIDSIVRTGTLTLTD